MRAGECLAQDDRQGTAGSAGQHARGVGTRGIDELEPTSQLEDDLCGVDGLASGGNPDADRHD